MRHCKLYIAALAAAAGCALCAASPRSQAEMKAIASAQLEHSRFANATALASLYEVYADANLAVIATRSADGGFAVVSRDDLHPALLAVADGSFNPDANPALRLWLKETSAALEAARRTGELLKFPTPDPKLYPDHVDPLVTSLWGQAEPFNLLCPPDPWYEDTHLMTGCVATAVSQVMNHYQYPPTGVGQHSVEQEDGTILSVDFDANPFDWSNILNDYNGEYTAEQGAAVANLLYNVGIASGMQYGAYASSTSAESAAYGLRRFLCYPTAYVLKRNAMKDSRWMDIIYNELLDGSPVVYNAVDVVMGGHSFIVDGYRADGMVHVNWGWNGNSDGWFAISGLQLDGFTYDSYHSVIIGLRPAYRAPEPVTVSCPAPGKLAEVLTGDKGGEALKVRGVLNADDLLTLREMAGRLADGRRSDGRLAYLDLSEAVIAYDLLPDHAFAGSTSLRRVILPEELDSIGTGVFAGCPFIESVTMPESGETFLREGNLVYNADKSELITMLPGEDTDATVAEGVEKICPEAFSGRGLVHKIDLPATITEIGDEAFKNCFQLTEITLRAREVPETADNILDGVEIPACTLRVHGGSRKLYAAHHVWGTFIGTDNTGSIPVDFDNIDEFGTTVTVRDAVRDYGSENPRFGYKTEGETLLGIPEITCEATPQSLPGTYPIKISRGTVTNEDVVFVDGTLTVLPGAGIDGIRTDADSDAKAYGTDGLPVTDGRAKGIVIRNGRKTVKKQ